MPKKSSKKKNKSAVELTSKENISDSFSSSSENSRKFKMVENQQETNKTMIDQAEQDRQRRRRYSEPGEPRDEPGCMRMCLTDMCTQLWRQIFSVIVGPIIQAFCGCCGCGGSEETNTTKEEAKPGVEEEVTAGVGEALVGTVENSAEEVTAGFGGALLLPMVDMAKSFAEGLDLELE